MVVAARDVPSQVRRGALQYKRHFSLYKILFHFKALLWESIILSLPPPTCNAYSSAIRLHGHCVIYAPHRPPLCMPYTIHCWWWQYCVKAQLAFTRYSFTCRRVCTNQSSFHSSGPPAIPTLLQYYFTIIGQYTTPLELPCVCHTPYKIGNNNVV